MIVMIGSMHLPQKRLVRIDDKEVQMIHFKYFNNAEEILTLLIIQCVWGL